MGDDDFKKETESAFFWAAAISLILAILSGMILDCGEISYPAGAFFISATAYLFIRIGLWKTLNKTPKLTKMQIYAVKLFPLYGIALSFPIISFIRAMK